MASAAVQNETETAEEVVAGVLERFGRQESKLIPILQALQEELGYLPKAVMGLVASALDLPPAKVYGVATFYAHFALEPKGRFVIRLCDGTACHVKRADGILEALTERLALPAEGGTTSDLLFTVETVSCLGACGLAPVMLINEDVHGQVTPEQALTLVDEIRAAEAGA
ncbi:MAG: NADH-quinone oxidoreductase subunit NuoE family protein [Planctomycetota bacterium]|jgi:NADH-quinone oxidoreductase subunit E